MPRQADLGFGQRAGLVRAQYIPAAEVVDRAEPLDDDMRAGHAQGAARERDRDNHRQQFGCEPDREGDGKWKARKPGPVEQQIDQQHEQHQDLGEPDDQQPEPPNPLRVTAEFCTEMPGFETQPSGLKSGRNRWFADLYGAFPVK